MNYIIVLVLLMCLCSGLTATAQNHGYWMFPPLSGYGHHPASPNDKFLNPDVITVCTSSLDGVTAKLTAINEAFEHDGCYIAKPRGFSSARLEITKDGKPLLQKCITGFSTITGPQLSPNVKALPTVTIDVVGAHDDYRSFDYFSQSNSYMLSASRPVLKKDDSREAAPIKASRKVVYKDVIATLKWDCQFANLNNGGQNFTLQINKGGRTVWSAPVSVDSATSMPDYSIECYGPIVMSLDGSSKTSVLLRYKVYPEGSNSDQAFDLIFYDDSSGKYKQFTQPWLHSPPHLADHDRDGKVEFITENPTFAQLLWGSEKSPLGVGQGGPLQVLRWTKNNRLEDVTRQLPREVKRHSEFALRQFQQERTYKEPYLLGYVGDLFSLGQQQKALSELNHLGTQKSKKELDRIIETYKSCGYLR